MIPLKSISAPETFEAHAAAKRLLDQGVGTDLQRVSILYGLCSASTLTSRLKQALDFAHQIIEVAERLDDPTYQVVGYRQLGTLQFYAGQNREALQSLQKGNAYRDPRRQRALSYRFGWDQARYPFLRSIGAAVARPSRQRRASQRTGAIELLSHGHATTIASATFCTGPGPSWCWTILPGWSAIAPNSRPIAPKKGWSRFACWPASTWPTPAPCANLSGETSRPFALRSTRCADQVEMPEAPSPYAILPKRCWRREIPMAPRPLCGTASPSSSNPGSITGWPVYTA